MYLWFYLGPTIGGADVKAVMTIGLITPFTLSFGSDAFTAFETRGFPYPFVVFMNSLLFYLFIPLGFAFYNVIKGNFERPYFQLFFGTLDFWRERPFLLGLHYIALKSLCYHWLFHI